MSLPFYKITCTACSYEGGYNYATHFQYEGEASHEPVMESVWCEHCDKIISACFPFTVELATEKINEKNAWINRNRSGFFSRFSKAKRSEVSSAEEEIWQIKLRTTFFKKIHYQPRCIQCGKSELSPICLPFEEDVCEPLGVRHQCGGQLLAHALGRISFSRAILVTYDERGSIIRDEREQHQ